MMTCMEGWRPAVRRSDAALAVGLVCGTTNVAGVALFSASAPYVGFLELTRAALPGLALAVAVVVLAVLGRPSWWMLGSLAAASVASAAPWLGIGLQQRSSAWVAVAALGVVLAPALMVAALVYPDGRFGRAWARWVAVALAAVAVLAATVATMTYDPNAWGWCQCVANPLAVERGPATYAHVTDALTSIHAAVVVVGPAAFLATTPRPLRRVTIGFTATLVVLSASWLVEDAAALLDRGPAPVGLGGVREAALVLFVVLYVAGYADHRPSRAHVADLLLAAREENQPSRLRDLVARAIGDPRASVAWWDATTDEFRDHLDQPVEMPDTNVLPVVAGGRPIALVLSDRLPSLEPAVRDAVAEALLLSSENRRLTAELQASLEQVRDSRARILTASDETRRRFERDLHDGAQQLLISTGIKLNLAAAQAGQGDTAALAQVLDEAQAELNRALAELRNLASGIAPTALVHGTLDNALRELALRSTVPTTVRVTGDREPDELAAATVYFVVAECLTNVAKHAAASRASVEVDREDPVRIRVTDDGTGGASLDGTGTGLSGLLDRVEARGGRLDVVSGTSGTTIEATVPLEPARATP